MPSHEESSRPNNRPFHFSTLQTEQPRHYPIAAQLEQLSVHGKPRIMRRCIDRFPIELRPHKSLRVVRIRNRFSLSRIAESSKACEFVASAVPYRVDKV